MTVTAVDTPLDPTPPRPSNELAAPTNQLRYRVEVSIAHLANPVLAVQRLLASDAAAYSRVIGDDTAFEILIAIDDPSPETVARTTAWVRWVVHHAGVRGQITENTPASNASGES